MRVWENGQDGCTLGVEDGKECGKESIEEVGDKISSGGARVDNDVQSISNGLILSSTVPRVDNDANINQLSTKV